MKLMRIDLLRCWHTRPLWGKWWRGKTTHTQKLSIHQIDLLGLKSSSIFRFEYNLSYLLLLFCAKRIPGECITPTVRANLEAYRYQHSDIAICGLPSSLSLSILLFIRFNYFAVGIRFGGCSIKLNGKRLKWMDLDTYLVGHVIDDIGGWRIQMR